MRYRSWDVFSLGSRCLPTSHGQIRPWYSGTQSHPPRWLTSTGLSPSTVGRSRPLRLNQQGGRLSPANLTSPQGFRRGFDLGSSPFGRPYSGNPMLVSFPPPTKMFPFGGFPLSTRGFIRSTAFLSTAGSSPAVAIAIQRSPDRRLHAPPRGISPLAASFVGAQAKPSTRRRDCLAQRSWLGLRPPPMRGLIVPQGRAPWGSAPSSRRASSQIAST